MLDVLLFGLITIINVNNVRCTSSCFTIKRLQLPSENNSNFTFVIQLYDIRCTQKFQSFSKRSCIITFNWYNLLSCSANFRSVLIYLKRRFHDRLVTIISRNNGARWKVLARAAYSSDLTPTDYRLFRSMQRSLVGQHFRNVADKRNVIFSPRSSRKSYEMRGTISNINL